jgi:predicted ATP-grasp superfamily ATP-dependent carboligase
VDAGFEVVAFARKGRRSALRHSSRVSVTEVTPPELNFDEARVGVEQLLVARANGGQRGVVLPLDDAALCLCSQLKLGTKWALAGPKGVAAELPLDKGLQVSSAEAAGMKVPATSIANQAQEVLARRAELPLVLRPAKAVMLKEGRLKKGRNWICATQSELERAISAWAEAWPLMIQPFIQGNGEGVFGLATRTGIIGWSAHRRLRMMNPHGSGSSACVSQPVPNEIKPPVEQFIRQTGWTGLFMVELLRDASGVLWFVEFNGRPWGSMALSRRQGLEYPAWAARCALDPAAATDIQPATERRVVCRNAGRELMHLLFVLRGPKSQALKAWPSSWQTARELLHFRRGDSFYNWRRDDLKVFFSDCWYTLHDNVFKPKRG